MKMDKDLLVSFLDTWPRFSILSIYFKNSFPRWALHLTSIPSNILYVLHTF